MAGAGEESFAVRPARGWLHPDSVLAREGVVYAVRYIGCLEVLTSMKKLDFDTRSQVAKECIVRVCEAAGLKSADKKRRVPSAVSRALAEKPRMSHSGSNVALTVSSRALTLTALDGGEVVARHEMPRVSFASGGDAETLDFVAYVGKSGAPSEWRACYVLECGGRLAQDVISTVGQAFELRFKEFLTKPSTLKVNGGASRSESAAATLEDRDYYNDMPGKMPPEPPPPARHLPAPFPPPHTLQPLNSSEESSRHYVNQTPPPRTPPTALLPNAATDIFDMQPFTAAPVQTDTPGEAAAGCGGGGSAGCGGGADAATAVLSAHAQAALLACEPWFHGPITRSAAEQLVEEDGDFLVRESCACAGQFVLTGARRGQRKHLLLVDPHGIVRTKDRIFESVTHLIKYHSGNELPIVSADSALLLRRPVLKRDSQ